MSTNVEAVFENGVFRPLQPVRLAEHQRVTVTIDDQSADTADHVQFVQSLDRWQAFCDALDAPAKEIPALRQLITEPSLFDGNRNSVS
jgi:predicted DNA-binding antitoxin AbrB/MazE fold protein